MSNYWMRATCVCNVSKPVFGITADDNGTIYFTMENQCIYQVQNDHINSVPHILVTVKGAWLNGIVWNSRNNTLYVCAGGNTCKIHSYSIDTGKLSTITGNGYWYEEGNLMDARFSNPQGITMDRNGDLYVAEFHCIRKINLVAQTVVTIAGSRAAGSKDGYAKQATFNYPFGLAFSDDGTIYVSDQWNQCIRKINKDGIVLTVAGTPGVIGYQDGPLDNSQFNNPRSLIMDGDGSLIVGDQNGLRRVDRKRQIVSTVLSKEKVFSIVQVKPFEFLVGTDSSILKIVNTWKWKRWIWIGHLKENPNDCLLATLPRELIKEITKH